MHLDIFPPAWKRQGGVPPRAALAGLLPHACVLGPRRDPALPSSP